MARRLFWSTKVVKQSVMMFLVHAILALMEIFCPLTNASRTRSGTIICVASTTRRMPLSCATAHSRLPRQPHSLHFQMRFLRSDDTSSDPHCGHRSGGGCSASTATVGITDAHLGMCRPSIVVLSDWISDCWHRSALFTRMILGTSASTVLQNTASNGSKRHDVPSTTYHTTWMWSWFAPLCDAKKFLISASNSCTVSTS